MDDPIKTETYCRTCLGTTNELFALETNHINLLAEMTSVQIPEMDEFSRMICHPCTNCLFAFKTFKTKCVDVDEHLRKYRDVKCELERATDSTDICGSEPSAGTNSDAEIKCTLCTRTFRNPQHLRAHMTRHKRKNVRKTSFPCACGRVFARLRSRNEHECDEKTSGDGVTEADVLTSEIKEEPPPKPDNDFAERHECFLCAKVFTVKRNFVAHIKRHTDKLMQKDEKPRVTVTTHACGICAKTFDKLKYLRKHERRHGGEELERVKNEEPQSLTCTKCGKVFKKRMYLLRHVKRHNHPQMVCPVDEKCQMTTYRLSGPLITHIRTQHPNYAPALKCPNCEDRFYIPAQLERHQKIEHGSGICPDCGHYFDELRKHRRTHVKMETFECDVCTRKFRIKANLDVHRRTHATGADDRVVCSICGTKVQNIELHMRRMHPAGDEARVNAKMSCRYCKKLFETLSAVVKHQKDEHEEQRALRANRFSCDQCEKKFMSLKTLWGHIRIQHQKLEPFECKICGRKTKNRYGAKLHMRVHTDERPYTCEYCGRKFRSVNTLRDHRNIHTGARPHVCPVCEKGFTQRTAMMTHWRKHN